MRGQNRLQLLAVFLAVCYNSVSGNVYGQECGDNPMQQVITVAKTTGKSEYKNYNYILPQEEVPMKHK